MDTFRVVDERLDLLQHSGYSCNRIRFRAKENSLSDLLVFYLTSTSGVLEEEIAKNPNFLKETPPEKLSQIVEDELNKALKEEAERRELRAEEGNVIYVEELINSLRNIINDEPIIYSKGIRELLELRGVFTGDILKQIKSGGYVHLHKHRYDLQVIILKRDDNLYDWFELYSPTVDPCEQIEILADIKNTIARVGEMVEDKTGYN